MSLFEQNFTKNTRPVDFSREEANAFMRNVFTTMALGLILSGAAAYFVATSEQLMQFFFTGFTKWIVMLAPLGIVIFLGARINKMSFGAASTTFAIYSLINGISLSFIFYIYTMSSISKVFFITAGTFLAMVAVGYSKRVDLSKWGSMLYMALIGLIIAMLVNFFLKSEMFDYIISGIGVLLFSGLTAYDTQKLLQIGAEVDHESDSGRKIALMGALNLYLDFINLFLFLLRFFGGRD